MTSPAIVRVKRRLEEVPADALVLHCKRIKTEGEHLTPSLFVFSGTVEEQDHAKISHIKKSWLKSHDRSHILDTSLNIQELLKKLKAEHDLQARENRIKVVNYSRGIKLSSEEGGGDVCEEHLNNHCSVLDLHHAVEDKESHAENTPSTSTQYAYDLYLSHQNDFDVDHLDNVVRVVPYHGDLVFGSYRDNGRPVSDDDIDIADEDSNDENNYKNEYPDTDESIHEEDMRRAMRNCSIDESLSSDEFDEDLVYGRNSTKHEKYPGIKQDDIERFGLAYARYKAKLQSRNQLKVDGEPSLIDVEEDECYSPANSRSDDGLDSSDNERGSDRYTCDGISYDEDYDND